MEMLADCTILQRNFLKELNKGEIISNFINLPKVTLLLYPTNIKDYNEPNKVFCEYIIKNNGLNECKISREKCYFLKKLD